MKTAILKDIKKITMGSEEMPVLNAGEVLIKVKYAGVCGSDLHAYKGMHPFRKPPVILGHEVVGTVCDTAPDVSQFKKDDLVTVMPAYSCGNCILCRSGKTNICLNKLVPGMPGWTGTFAEYFKAPAKITYPLSPGISAEGGVLAEPLATAVHSVRMAGVGEGRQVLILGGGTIGILAAMVAKAQGAKSVAITDVFDFNLRMAGKLCGADCYNALQANVQEALLDAYPEKFDSVILCASAEETIHQSVALVRRGGRIVVTGMYLKPIPFNFIDLTLGEIAMLGSQIYTDEDFKIALQLLAERRFDFTEIVTHKLPLEKADEALRILSDHSENAVKILLEM